MQTKICHTRVAQLIRVRYESRIRNVRDDNVRWHLLELASHSLLREIKLAQNDLKLCARRQGSRLEELYGVGCARISFVGDCVAHVRQRLIGQARVRESRIRQTRVGQAWIRKAWIESGDDLRISQARIRQTRVGQAWVCDARICQAWICQAWICKSRVIEFVDGDLICANGNVVGICERRVGRVGVEKNRAAEWCRCAVIFGSVDQDAGERHRAAGIRHNENGKRLRREGIHFYRLRDLSTELLKRSRGAARLGGNGNEKTSGRTGRVA